MSPLDAFFRFLRAAWPVVRQLSADEAIEALRRGYEAARRTQLHDRTSELEAHRRAIDELLAQRER